MALRRVPGVSLFLCAAVLLVAGCGADPSSQPTTSGPGVSANKVTGSVSEWRIDTSASRARPGSVLFAIANFGTIEHEFLVVRTAYGPGGIPVGDGGRFDERDPGIEVVDEIGEWPAGEARTLRVDLTPGTYELLCNLPGHYSNGMHHVFVVE